MKNTLFALILLCSSFWAGGSYASGSDTVFILGPQDYKAGFLKNDDPRLEKAFQLSLQEAHADLFAIHISQSKYRAICFSLWMDKNVFIKFEGTSLDEVEFNAFGGGEKSSNPFICCPERTYIIGTTYDKVLWLRPVAHSAHY